VPIHSDVTGFVLAGGKSSRMGSDKSLLPWNGSTLLQQTKNMVQQVCEKVFVLGPRDVYGSFGECIEDIYADCGPLGGIHAALTHATTAYSLITAVDTPFISPEFLAYMIKRALSSSAIVTSPRIGGAMQPTCAVFSRDFLKIAEEALKSGKYKLEPLFPREQTLVLNEADLSGFANLAEMFENLNTPQDFEQARRRISTRQR
jgi:molybdopterin-guanine dinucleotide biosynthesis protein A